MATYYSQGSGNWSTLSNWDTNRAGGGSDPASIAAMDNNTFVIQPGHVVTFDIEDAVAADGSISGWTTGLAALNIEGHATTPGGVLQLSTVNNSANRVYNLALKAGASIAGTNLANRGQLLGGTASVPMPTGAVHVIQQYGATASSFLNATYLDVALYAAAPLQTVYTLTAAAGTGDTSLTVTPNPASEVEWRAGWAVRVDDVNRAAESTVAALHSTTPVGTNVINLAGAIGVAKSIGAKVILTQRNIEVRQNGTATSFIAIRRSSSATSTTPVVGCSVRSAGTAGYGIWSDLGVVFTAAGVVSGFGTAGFYTTSASSGTFVSTIAGVISGCSAGVSTCYRCVISGLISGGASGLTSSHNCEVSGTIFGCSNAVNSCRSCTVSGLITACDQGVGSAGTLNLITGAITNCSYGASSQAELVVSGSISGCSYGIGYSTARLLGGAVLSGNTSADITGGATLAVNAVGYGTSLLSSPQVINYLRRSAPGYPGSVVMWDHGGVARKYPLWWCCGGYGAPELVTVPTALDPSLTEACKMMLEQEAGIAVGLYSPNWLDFQLYAPASVEVKVVVYVCKDALALTGIPTAQILDPSLDLWTGAPLATASMSDSLNTWEMLTLAYTEPTRSRNLVLRFRATHNSGSVYWAHRVLTCYQFLNRPQ